jgi:hypothetical protein
MNASSGDDPVVEQNPVGKSDDLTGRALRLRIRQQELLAELGVLALQGASFVEMLNHTARITAEGLRAEYCKVMEFLPAENRLVVRAGVGWEEGVVGHATVGADLASPAGYALRTGKPVISNHLENEQRFRRRDNRIEILFAAVRFWPSADIPITSLNVRFRGESGHGIDGQNVRL